VISSASIRTVRWIIVGGLLLVSLAACREEQWDGFVYPSRADLTQHIVIGQFSSLESCRNEAYATLERNGWAPSGDYECGLNCKPWGSSGMMVCEETQR
jgi:hypothetical protein